ncbi:MAG: DUF2608 domain-containing protein [Proteobacteria bacterium]|nr:DUF2608 domain-containing protein [Pseudomonadota bacterium]
MLITGCATAYQGASTGAAAAPAHGPAHPPARDPLPNTAANKAANFEAVSANYKDCEPPEPEEPYGDITYSGLVSLGKDRWVYVRDTKNCIEHAVFGNQTFGIVEKGASELEGAEVTLDLSGIDRETRPTDLEAICLASDVTADGFELLAAESGGHEAGKYRRIYKFRFELQRGRWNATIAGSPVSYHAAIAGKDAAPGQAAVPGHAGAPQDFEAEGMICTRVDENTYRVLLGGRGNHRKMREKGWRGVERDSVWVERRGGGLLPLVVDFSDTRVRLDTTYGDLYPEVVARRCKLPDRWQVIDGEFRDIADLYVSDSTVWAIATFDGKIGNTKAPYQSRNHYCSVIYRLCATGDCRDLWNAPPKRDVTGWEIPGRKVEGLTAAIDPDKFAIASDEEQTGFIDVNFSPSCEGAACNVPLLTFPRTEELKHPVEAARALPRDEQVLAVFDLDDTLMTMQQDLGGNAWFKWQEFILDDLRPDAASDGTVLRVGNGFGELLDVQGVLYSLFDMRPTQNDTVDLVVDRLSDRGIPAYALTARGPDYRDATHRELGRLNIEFPDAPPCAGALCSTRGAIDGRAVVAAAAAANMDRASIDSLKGRTIAIDDGVMMVSGENKGVMLRLLLASFADGVSFDHVVFVDDDIKNVIHVAEQSALFGAEISVHPYHYTRFADETAEFLDKDDESGRQLRAAGRWARIKEAICRGGTMDWCSYPLPPNPAP